MKTICLIVLIFCNLNAISQEKYHFDYYTIYDYKKDPFDTSAKKEIYYSNSKDSTFILVIFSEKNSTKSVEIIDFKNQKKIIYKDSTFNVGAEDQEIFKKYYSCKYSLDYCREIKTSKYDIVYSNVENKKIFNIKRFKNNSRNKLINESFFETEPTTITKNQHYNFCRLTMPLWCNKFIIKNNELINYSYFIEKNKKVHIRQLEKIDTINFDLETIPTKE